MLRYISLGIGLIVGLFVLNNAVGGPRPESIALVRGEPSPVSIHAGDDADPCIRYAAQELRRFLLEMSGVDLPIVTHPALRQSSALVICATQHMSDREGFPDIEHLGKEGYVLRVVGRRLIIAGGRPRGTLYGVYGLLQDHLGCRWFTPDVSHIPSSDRLEIPVLDVEVNPILEYREPFVKEAQEIDWAARNRVNGNFVELSEKHGGKVSYRGFVHTYETLVPPDEYFDEYPDFFSLIDGKRLKYRSQFCNTNPRLAEVVTEKIRQLMREHPEDTVFSVSQNDWHNFCQCESCTALAEAEGTQAAPVLHLVNQVARAVRDEFPDNSIDTLAYLYSRKPPKTMRPEPNVIVRLCSIECCFNHPFVECSSDRNRAFVEDIVGWSKLSERIWVWDYVTSFSHFLMPFPNLHVRAPNIRFLSEHNVRGIFEQDVYNTLDGELSGLSGYLGAQLLWNPDADHRRLVEEFVAGVYGDAAPFVLEYIAALEGTTADPEMHSEVWDGPDAPYITDDFLRNADRLWLAAEAAAANSPKVLSRVRKARMPVDYAILEHARFAGLRTLASADEKLWGVKLPLELTDRIERFFHVVDTSDLTQFRELGDSVDEYKSGWTSLLAAPDRPALPATDLTELSSGLHYEFYEGRWTELPAFDEISPASEGVATCVSLEVSPLETSYALRFEGYFKAPETGLYCFTLVTNDGSRMFIDGEMLIDHDYRHMAIPRGNLVPLEAGYHPVIIEYFQSNGRKHLELFAEGPGLDRQPVPLSLLWHAE